MSTVTAPFYRHRSALEQFQCPFSFQKKYLEGVADDSDPARRGRAFHAAKKHYIRLLVQHACSDDLDLAQTALRQGLRPE